MKKMWIEGNAQRFFSLARIDDLHLYKSVSSPTGQSIMTSIIAFSISGWFSDSLGELVRYFDHLNSTEWAIISVSAVAFGFMCLKGQSLRN